MKKKVRNIMNVAIGATLGLLLPACHVQKSAAKKSGETIESEEKDQPQLIEEDRRMICLYGIPPEILRQREEQEKREQEQQQDSTSVK